MASRGNSGALLHHRDTEYTEHARRIRSVSPRVLRVSVVKTVSNFFRRNTCYHIVLFRLQRSEGGLIFAR